MDMRKVQGHSDVRGYQKGHADGCARDEWATMYELTEYFGANNGW